MRAACGALFALALLAGTAGATEPYDLNGDGRGDLVLGLPDFVHERDTLGVLIARGSRDGLVGRRTVFTRRSFVPTRGRFPEVGSSITSADLDGDGFADLVLGVPGLKSDPDDYHGGLVVAYGGPDLIGERRLVIEGPPTDPDIDFDSTDFGASVVAADFTGDGHPDLAVGAPRYGFPEGKAHPAGAVYLLLGRPDGGFGDPVALARPTGRRFSKFGTDLAVGDLNADGHLDLVEADDGTPGDFDGRPLPGHLTVALGGPSGPTQFEPVEHDFRGGPTSLAAGDVTGDEYPDLVAGVADAAFWRFDAGRSAGEVLIWPGGANGLAPQPIVVDQESRGVPGSNERYDSFGQSVLVSRVDPDRFADILVSVPLEGEDSRGRVLILRGASGGIGRAGHSIVPRPRRATIWGGEMALRDFDGDDRKDLALFHFREEDEAVSVLRRIRGGFARVAHTLRLKGFEDQNYCSVLALDDSSSEAC